ncbi:MAG: MotA/TolQ/ExbB proton channel family protein [Lautropia sp.]
MQTDPSMGPAAFLAQLDAVGVAVLVALATMSIWSWTLILWRLMAGAPIAGRSARFLQRFRAAASVDEVHAGFAARAPDEAFGRVAHAALEARRMHAELGAQRLELAGSPNAFLTRTIRKLLDEEAARRESGLTSLATIGATAPFVGLFGTVWSVYRALTAIGRSGSASLERVAGPVGEALVMTGIGLLVAIPAVIAYNAFVRGNRVRAARLDSFAHELLALLTMGTSLRAFAASSAADAGRREV